MKNKVADSQNKVVDWKIGDSLSKQLGESPLTILVLLKLKVDLALSHAKGSYT
jgi:hypothetical protein